MKRNMNSIEQEESKKRARRGEKEGKQRNSVGLSLRRRRNSVGLAAMFLVMMIMMPFAGWGQVTITTDANGNGTIEDSEKNLYLIRTKQVESFYMVSQNNNVSTANLPHTSMLWYFLEAENDNGTRYYYIVNNSTGKYICNTNYSSSGRTINLADFDPSSTDKFKFKLVENTTNGTTGFYNICIKPNGSSWIGLNKQSGSVSSQYPIRLTNDDNNHYINDANSKWDFIAFDNNFSWPNPPFTLSPSESKTYYRIRNKQNDAYYVSTGSGSPKYVTNASTESNDMAWYFKEAPYVDDATLNPMKLKYYYIINPAAEDQYMYFRGTVSDGDQTDAVEVKVKSSENEDRYQFFVVRAARVVSNNSIECYMIVPKLLIVNLWNSNSLGINTQSDGANLKIMKGRVNTNTDVNYAHWTFAITVYPMSCSTPTITYSIETGKITITTTTPDAVIYYTTDGTEPSSTEGTLYTVPFEVSDRVTIKAIATKTGYGDSPVETVSFEQVATPGFELTDDAKVRLTCATSGASIYYAMGTTQPTSVTIDPSNLYSGPIENADGKYIAAVAVKDGLWINSTLLQTGQITFPCAMPVITKTSATTFTITCSYPTSGVTIYYETGVDPEQTLPPSSSSTNYISSGATVTFAPEDLPFTVKAIAMASGYENSDVATKTIREELTPDGEGNYHITNQTEFETFVDMANTADGAQYHYVLDANVTAVSEITEPFTGTFDGNYHTITNLSQPFFNTVNGGIVKNVMLKDVSISQSGKVGGIAGVANGDARIYNCGVLPSDPNLTTASTISSTDDYCGGIVGMLDGTARVINCFSFANITGGTTVAGIVGHNNTSDARQDNYTGKTIVVNCMFYGEITGGSTKYPVYGGNAIINNGYTSINNYNYYRGEATFDDSYDNVSNYNRSWPAEERNLRQFEYYRSILNSNRRLCTFWITDKQYGSETNAPTTEDEALMAKWVVDRSIAPYPVLKKWDKYPSIINPDPDKVWDTIHNQWVQRTAAAPYQGKKFKTLDVTIRTGAHPGEEGMTGISVINDKSWTLPITDMDTLNHDYCYYKVQLPYYNEVFGDLSETESHIKRYYGNYTNKVVTGWKIISVNNNDQGGDYTFNTNWESGCNYANRYDKYKDLYAKSDRVFAQGGYYYVPEGVTAITIEAYWGTAFYLHGKNHSVDRVSVCTYDGNYGYAFSPAGTLPNKWVYNDMTIYNDLETVMGALSTSSATVYDQAIVLVGNFQVQARNDISLNYTNGKKVTFMSADLDMDNEPDYCWQFQWRGNTERLRILPVRFDFLPIPELGLAIRHNKYAYAIGIFVPLGHFEITETAFMHTTQFEYMMSGNPNHQQPLIFNGGEFEQIVAKGGSNLPEVASIRNIIMGGHVWMKRFTPGSHNGNSHKCRARHCAVSVMGGEYPEFYLSGLYRTDITTSNAYNDNPHCYTNGGRFGIMAGAGMEAVRNSVYFEIDHSIIREFYGGGINGNEANRVNGNINVTINNSLVLDKYCGGPKVGKMNSGKTVTTNATGTIFNQYFGGGNGGNNLYRDQIYDNNVSDMPNETDFSGSTYGWKGFTPISNQNVQATYDESKGYHAEFEFEVFNQSNGINDEAVVRTYRHWAQFGTTITGDVTNTLVNCTIKRNYYGGGNLGNVNGNVTSTLTDCTILGSAYGGGYSASIPEFSVHDKSKVSFPRRDAAGVCHNGTVGYRTDGVAPNEVIRKYTWCYKNSTTNVVTPSGVTIPSGVSTSKPAFQCEGKWYCYTTESLENLGEIAGDVTLTLKGNTTVGTLENGVLKPNTGNVYGGGDESAVSQSIDSGTNAPVPNTGNTTVNLQDGVIVHGNVYGGGNKGPVGGKAEVKIQDE